MKSSLLLNDIPFKGIDAQPYTNGSPVRSSTASNDRYDHFKKILKRKQHFSSISTQQDLRAIEERKTVQSQQKPKTQPLGTRKQVGIETQEIKQIMLFNKIEFVQDPLIGSRSTKNPLRESEFYSLPNISYKNYKHQRPPLGFSTEQFLIGSYRIGQRLGVWQKDKLADKINQQTPNGIIQMRERSYKADHLERSRRPQGPQSCLETIYMSKIKLDEVFEQQNAFNQSDSANHQFVSNQQKLLQIESNLQAEISVQQVQYPSQAYILNKWTRENRDQVYTPCQKRDDQTKYSSMKKQITQGIVKNQTMMNNLIKQKSQSTLILDSNNQMIKHFAFPNFNQIKLKTNSCKQKFQQLVETQVENKKLLLLKTFLDNFQQFTFNPPLISQRLILSLDLPDPKVTQNALSQSVPYKIFEKFYTVYVEKRANIDVMVNTVLDFFVLDYTQDLSNQQFCIVLKLLCNNFPHDGQDQMNAQSIYLQLLENYTLSGVLGQSNDIVNLNAFRSIYLTNQMHIFDIIDFINGLN